MKQLKVKTNQILQVTESAENVQINRKIEWAYENISEGKPIDKM